MPVNAGSKVAASDSFRPYCELQNPASQTLPIVGFTQLTLPNVVEDNNGMASTATNSIVVKQPGRYRITGQCTWNASAAARGVFIVVNGQYRASVTNPNTSNADQLRLQVTRTFRLAVNDKIQIHSYTTVATNTDPNYGGVWLSVEMVSP